MLLSVEVIAFYVWVLGVAIAGIWKKLDTHHDWFKGSLVMLGDIFLAMVVAIAIWCWVGPKGIIALASFFAAYHIVSAYQNLKKWWKSNNINNSNRPILRLKSVLCICF